jgi:putative transposase
MRRFSGACRFVYNKALALQKARHEQGEKKLSAFELNNLLPQWKAESEQNGYVIHLLKHCNSR